MLRIKPDDLYVDIQSVLAAGGKVSLVDWYADDDPEACPGTTIEMENTLFAVTDRISAGTSYHRNLREALAATIKALTFWGAREEE